MGYKNEANIAHMSAHSEFLRLVLSRAKGIGNLVAQVLAYLAEAHVVIRQFRLYCKVIYCLEMDWDSDSFRDQLPWNCLQMIWRSCRE